MTMGDQGIPGWREVAASVRQFAADFGPPEYADLLTEKVMERIAAGNAERRSTESLLWEEHLRLQPDEHLPPPGNTGLGDLLYRVSDRATFLAFVSALIADWHIASYWGRTNPSNPTGPGAIGWGSETIGDFLAAASTWADGWTTRPEADFPRHPFPESAVWQAFARFLYMGRINAGSPPSGTGD